MFASIDANGGFKSTDANEKHVFVKNELTTARSSSEGLYKR